MRGRCFDVRALRADDSGFALVIVMAVVAVITAIAIGGYVMASQTLQDSRRVGDQNRAYQAASTGLEQEISYFNPDNIAALQDKTVALNATDRYTIRIETGAENEYWMTSTGTSGGQSEAVLVKFQYLNLWDMNVSGGGSMGTGNGLNGSSKVIGPIYVKGDFDFSQGNGYIYQGPVFVKDGQFLKGGSSTVGINAEHVKMYADNDPAMPYVEWVSSAPELNLPTLSDDNMQYYLELARNCASEDATYSVRAGRPANTDATYYTVFNGDTSLGGTDFGDPNNDAIAVANGNTLVMRNGAVVYVDGTLTITSNIQYYRGNGILVAKNGFVVNGNLVPSSVNIDHNLDKYNTGETIYAMDGDNCLALLTQGGIQNNGDYTYAAVFMNGDYVIPANAHNVFRGALICRRIEADSTNVILCTQRGLGGLFFNKDQMPQLAGFTARSDWIRR